MAWSSLQDEGSTIEDRFTVIATPRKADRPENSVVGPKIADRAADRFAISSDYYSGNISRSTFFQQGANRMILGCYGRANACNLHEMMGHCPEKSDCQGHEKKILKVKNDRG